MKITEQLREEARAYYRLCNEARALGIPVSLDDPASPKTVEGLRQAVAEAKAEADYLYDHQFGY